MLKQKITFTNNGKYLQLVQHSWLSYDKTPSS